MNLEQAREQALTQLKTERRKASNEDWAKVVRIVMEYKPPADVAAQVWLDLRRYPLYDAIAMWLDEKSGLAAAVPEMMAAVADMFIKMEVTDESQAVPG